MIELVIGNYGNWNWAFGALTRSQAFEGYGKDQVRVITNPSRKKSGMKDCHEPTWRWRLTDDDDSTFRAASTRVALLQRA
jgi:hypothetical protein